MRMWGIRHPASNAEIVTDQSVLRAELGQAYRRGRRDERLLRRRSPFAMAAMVAMALIAAVVLVTAAREGSFESGGVVIDSQLDRAANVTVPKAIDDATARAGAGLSQAGQRLKAEGEKTNGETGAPPTAG